MAARVPRGLGRPRPGAGRGRPLTRPRPRAAGTPAAPAAPGRAPLTRDGLVRQALAALDADGFDGLTMRRLAERVGVKAASLYNHVRDKDELLTLLADAICAEVVDGPPPPAAEGVRAHLAAYARRLRAALLTHRDGARVLAATPPVGEHRLRLIERMLDLLGRLGLDDATVAAAASVVNSYIVGFVLDETLPGPPPDDPAAAEQVRAGFTALPPDRFPRLVALADHLVETPPGERFELGLTLLLDGLVRTGQSRRPAREGEARARRLGGRR